MKLPKKDSSAFRGAITGAQATISTFVVFATGLFGVIQSVPGCSDAVIDYLRNNAMQLSVFLGIPAGIASFVWNELFRKDVKRY